jgi:hypothetical protein
MKRLAVLVGVLFAAIIVILLAKDISKKKKAGSQA